MEQLRRSIGPRGKALLVAVAIIALGLIYYFFVHVPVTDEMTRIASAQADADLQLTTLQTKLATQTRMEQELLAMRSQPDAIEVARYDNLQPVMVALNGILQDSVQFSLQFSSVQEDAENGIVRRPVQMSFTCNSYQHAQRIIDALHGLPFRCQVKSVALQTLADVQSAGGTLGNLWEGSVSASVTVIFFEAL